MASSMLSPKSIMFNKIDLDSTLMAIIILQMTLKLITEDINVPFAVRQVGLCIIIRVYCY